MISLLHLDKKLVINKNLIDSPNLCDRLSDEDLTRIGQATWEGYRRDEISRIPWMRRMEAAMDLAMQIQKDKNFPWQGCSNVIFPLVTVATLQFSARSYSNIIQGNEVVHYRVAGEDPTGQLIQRADRIARHMSWQVLEEDSAWEEQHDRLLINLGIVGCNFVKTHFSSSKVHNVSELVMARDLVIDYWAKSVEDCARKTHLIPLYRNEIYEKVQKGIFRNVLDEDWYQSTPSQPQQFNKVLQDNRQGHTPPPADEDTPFRTLEQHRLLDLDGDGYSEPYVVTIEEGSKKVLRIVARFDREEEIDRKADRTIISIKPTEYFTKYSFIPAPDGGIYDVGFGVLLGPLNEAVNSGINQLLDSGTMQNSIGGFLGRGAKIRGGVYTMAPWEWKRVDSTGDDLRKSLVPYPERQPSTVMFQLLGLLISYTERVSGATETMTGENPGQNTPAYNMQNMMEQGMQVYKTIFKRVWRSMKGEFKKLHQLNAVYLPNRQSFGTKGNFILREDYKSNSDHVVPVADPNLTSDAQRYNQAQAIRAAAQQVPGYDIVAVEKNFLRAMRVDQIDVFYPGPDKVPPLPNPRASVEELKLKTKQMQFEYEKQKWTAELMEERKLNAAKIELIKAEITALLADATIAERMQKLKAFEVALEAMNRHDELLNERIQSMLAQGKSDEGNDSVAGAVQSVESRPGDSGGVPAAAGMEGGAEGAMG